MIELFGYISAICFIFCFIPQIIRTWRLKSVDDISVWVYVLLTIGYSASLIYGMSLGEWPLISKDILGVSLSLLMLLMVYAYRDSRKDDVRKIVSDFLHDAKRKFR